LSKLFNSLSEIARLGGGVCQDLGNKSSTQVVGGRVRLRPYTDNVTNAEVQAVILNIFPPPWGDEWMFRVKYTFHPVWSKR